MENELQATYDIRLIDLKQVGQLRDLQRRSWKATYPSPENGVSVEWVEQRTSSWMTPEALANSRTFLEGVLADPNQFHRVAISNGCIVGFVHVSSKADGTKELEAIYTDPETFGTGLGDKLMAEADAWIDGASTILKVASYNVRAIRFYEKHGFKIVPDTEDTYAGVIPIITMKREGGRDHEI